VRLLPIMKPRLPNANEALKLAADPEKTARAAGLIYVSDEQPGIRRKGAGKGFYYLHPDGAKVTDEKTLRRIKSLVIPPAYKNVWICPRANGHIQATGYDERGRKQYRYHPQWREVRDATKYHRMALFGAKLPEIRARTQQDLARHGLPREKVLAAVVQLLDKTLIRVGNEEYARGNHSYGLTTMRNRHVDVHGATVEFDFKGKSGIKHHIDLRDRRLARVISQLQELPGQELFQYLDEDGHRQSITSADVNEYLRECGGEEFTAKDFRTWAGTVLAALALCECEAFTSETQANKNIVQAVKIVSAQLGNTPAVCRQCYVHPAIIASYLDGTLQKSLRDLSAAEDGESSTLRPEESAVLRLLRRTAK